MNRFRVASPFLVLSLAGASLAQEQPAVWDSPVEDHDPLYLSDVVAKGKLVFVSGTEEVDEKNNFDRAFLVALDRKTGQQVWSKQGDASTGNVSGASGEALFSPLAVSKSVVLAGGGREVSGPDYEGVARAWDQASGTLLWSKTFPGGDFTKVAAVGKRAFVATTLAVESSAPSIFLAAYDLLTGELLWDETYGPLAEDPFVLALVAGGGHVALTGQQKHPGESHQDVLVRVHDAATGEPEWNDLYDVDGGTEVGLCAAIKGQRLFVGGLQVSTQGDQDGVLRAYDLSGGQSLWTQSLAGAGQESVSMIQVRGSRVVTVSYVFPPSDYLVRAHSAKTGAVQWDEELGLDINFTSRSFALSGSRCIIPSDDGLIALAAKTGEPVWDAPQIGFAAAILGSRVYVAGEQSTAAYPVK